MLRRSRLSGMGNPMRSDARLKPVKYTLHATMVSPDQVQVDLFKNGKFVENLVTLEGAMAGENTVDQHGRLKPDAVWDAINTASQHLMERGVEHVKPNKLDIYQADYDQLSVYPKVME